MRSLAPFLVLACAAALAACGRTGTSGGRSIDMGDSSGGASLEGVHPVKGNVQVVLRTWNPEHPELGPSTYALVNTSSESGRKLASGKATSTVIRPISDEQMGALLAAIDQKGFSTHAKSGVTLEGLSPDSRRRGVIIVDDNGTTRGLEMLAQANLGGTPIPTVFRDCKMIIVQIHGTIQGYEARVSTSPADDRTFQAPPVRMKR